MTEDEGAAVRQVHPESQRAAAFWAYSLALYDRAAVARCCLDLQDRSGLDVNLLLYACWAGGERRRVDPPCFAALEATVALWRRQVIEPLRLVRRRLKPLTGESGGPIEALRQGVLAQELAAERHEQRLIAAAAESLEFAAEPGESALVASLANLQDYLLARRHRPCAEDVADLTQILMAACPGPRALPLIAALSGLSPRDPEAFVRRALPSEPRCRAGRPAPLRNSPDAVSPLPPSG